MKYLPTNLYPNREKVAEKKLADTRTSRDALAARLAVARGAVAESNTALQQLAVQGADDAALAAGEAMLRDTERRVSTLAPALAEIEKLLVTLEADRAELLDKKTRTATAAAANELADELIEAGAAYDASTAILAEVSIRALAVSFEANGLAVSMASSRIAVAAAIPVIGEVLRQHGRRVLNGSEPAKFPTPEAPFVADVVVRPVTKQVFCMKQVKWTTPEGLRFAPKYAILELPPDVADRGLALKACTPIPGDAWATYKGTYVPFSHHREAINLDLDVDAVAEGEPTGPLYGKAPMSKAFGHIPNPDFVETIGPVRQMRIVAGGAA
jgi:hypothetical protein